MDVCLQGSPGGICVGDGAAVDANTRGKDVHTAAIVGEARHARLDIVCTNGHGAGCRGCRAAKTARSSRQRSLSSQADYVLKGSSGLLLTARRKVWYYAA